MATKNMWMFPLQATRETLNPREAGVEGIHNRVWSIIRTFDNPKLWSLATKCPSKIPALLSEKMSVIITQTKWYDSGFSANRTLKKIPGKCLAFGLSRFWTIDEVHTGITMRISSLYITWFKQGVIMYTILMQTKTTLKYGEINDQWSMIMVRCCSGIKSFLHKICLYDINI